MFNYNDYDSTLKIELGKIKESVEYEILYGSSINKHEDYCYSRGKLFMLNEVLSTVAEVKRRVDKAEGIKGGS